MQRLLKDSDANAFIRELKATKKMYDAVQAMHPKTLSACWILATCTRKRFPKIMFRDMMEVVMESWPPQAPLRLKVFAHHCDSVRADDALPLKLLDLKTLLMPRQWFLKKLDPNGDFTVPELRRILEPHMIECRALRPSSC